jgi:hypothetical protein
MIKARKSLHGKLPKRDKWEIESEWESEQKGQAQL